MVRLLIGLPRPTQAPRHNMSQLDQPFVVSTYGLRCPEPLMQLYASLAQIPEGQLLRFETDDPASERDVRRMCGFLHHSIEGCESDSGRWVIFIRKKGAA